MTRQDKARNKTMPEKARQVKTIQDNTRQGTAGQNITSGKNKKRKRQGKIRLDKI